MAKHDQRILKFLTQNAERAPTITDMMTRLNISIADITDSLNSLMAQGLVSKRTNGQGIECWFPTSGPVPAAVAEPVPEATVPAEPSRTASPLASPTPPEPSPLPPLHTPTPASALTSSGVFANPAPAKSSALESAVFTASPAEAPVASANGSAPAPEPVPSAPPAPMNFALEPARSGVGWLPFLVGLIATGATAVYVSGHYVRKDIAQSSKGMVEKSEMEAAAASWADFETNTKAKVQALETQVNELNGQLAAMKAQNDSLQALAAKAEGSRKGALARKAAARRRR